MCPPGSLWQRDYSPNTPLGGAAGEPGLAREGPGSLLVPKSWPLQCVDVGEGGVQGP